LSNSSTRISRLLKLVKDLADSVKRLTDESASHEKRLESLEKWRSTFTEEQEI
jgi:hypothetical protein